MKRCVVLLSANKNVRKMRFWRHFAPVWRRVPKVCRGRAYRVTLGLPVKVRPNLLPYSRKSDLIRYTAHNEQRVRVHTCEVLDWYSGQFVGVVCWQPASGCGARQ